MTSITDTSALRAHILHDNNLLISPEFNSTTCMILVTIALAGLRAGTKHLKDTGLNSQKLNEYDEVLEEVIQEFYCSGEFGGGGWSTLTESDQLDLVERLAQAYNACDIFENPPECVKFDKHLLSMLIAFQLRIGQSRVQIGQSQVESQASGFRNLFEEVEWSEGRTELMQELLGDLLKSSINLLGMSPTENIDEAGASVVKRMCKRIEVFIRTKVRLLFSNDEHLGQELGRHMTNLLHPLLIYECTLQLDFYLRNVFLYAMEEGSNALEHERDYVFWSLARVFSYRTRLLGDAVQDCRCRHCRYHRSLDEVSTAVDELDETEFCPVCYESGVQMRRFKVCCHSVCTDCLSTQLRMGEEYSYKCGYCRADFFPAPDFDPLIMFDEELDMWIIR